MEKSDYIFGIRAVIEAIESGKSIDKVLIRKDLGGDLARELFAKIKEYGVLTQRVPAERLNRITMKNHQGVVAIVSPVTYHRLENLLPSLYEEGANPFMIVLDGLTDTRNFGAIGRTADCGGAAGGVSAGVKRNRTPGGRKAAGGFAVNSGKRGGEGEMGENILDIGAG